MASEKRWPRFTARRTEIWCAEFWRNLQDSFILGAPSATTNIMKLRCLILCSAFATILFPSRGGAQADSTNYDETKVGTYTLPDPLVFADGKPVRGVRDWSRRRSEILELFATHVYGHNPKPLADTKFEVFEESKSALGGKAIRKQVAIDLTSAKDGPKESLLIYIPAGARKPVPVILTLNFMGNQSVINDPGITLPTIWTWNTHERQQATEDSRGRDKEFEVEKILARSYAFATICYQDIDPD